MSKKKIFIFFLVAAVGLTLVKTKSFMQSTGLAYLYGYPIVIMDETRKSMQASYPEAHKRVNQLTHVQVFPDHNFRNVVRPNVDTLYSVAWLDLSKEPVILSVPDMHDRYYVMPLMDAWTNVFTTIGTRETGSQAGDYLIAGPSWQGKSTNSMPVIHAPTNMLWLIGRIQTNGLSDIPKVASLQTGFELRPLSAYKNNILSPQYRQTKAEEKSDINPYEIVDQQSALEFFNTLHKLIEAQGALSEDKLAIDNFNNLKLNFPIKENTLTTSAIKVWLMDKALSITKRKIKERLADRSQHENGWMVRRSGIGQYGTDYAVRTAVAQIGLGALQPEEAVYPNATIDSNNETLSGKNNYKIHFPAGNLPPVDAFWSLTMYDENGFLIESTINRYALGDRDNLEFNSDGSLDLLMQYDKPEALSNNWLPTPKGEFALTLRLYLPKEEFLNGDWKLPPIIKQ